MALGAIWKPITIAKINFPAIKKCKLMLKRISGILAHLKIIGNVSIQFMLNAPKLNANNYDEIY